MQKSIVCLFVLLIASMASTSTVWNPAGNGIYPPDTGDWGVAANWTNGVPDASTDDATGKAQFNKPDAAECVVSGPAVCKYFVQGDNNAGGVIRVVDGGNLTTGVNWSAVGYNNTAHMIVETGGTVTFGQHMWVGLIGDSVGILDINGGSFLWRQYYKAIKDAGVTMVYQAMFDEVDEATAIFKCSNNPPVGSTPFLPIGNATYPPYDISDADLPSDHYLWLVGEAGRMLRGEIDPTANMPLR